MRGYKGQSKHFDFNKTLTVHLVRMQTINFAQQGPCELNICLDSNKDAQVCVSVPALH